ncbi:hypothetical protein [Pseudomonas sp. ML96]|uniref:hypothetical protein n=1 Tax=Pseudomonas sp. ML96 TaxID=1523503 RepID=UPI0012E08DAF|nr:hypothetical protein [Pseudomonas sp. ML96]
MFDDKAKPLREWRWSDSDSSETPPPSLRVFSFRLNRPNAPLLAPRVKSARSHSRDTLHLHSACAWSKSARKRFVIKIKKQPAPGALNGRAQQFRLSLAEGGAEKLIQKAWPDRGLSVMEKLNNYMFLLNFVSKIASKNSAIFGTVSATNGA